MAKQIKRYQLLQGLSLMTYFTVNGRQRQISFANGMRTPFLIRGRFSTDDEDLQKAIESSNGFNVQYRLEHIDEIGGVKEETPAPPVVDTPEATEPPVEDTPIVDDVIPPDGEPVADATLPVDDGATPVVEAQPPVIPPASPVDYPDVKTVKDARQKLLDLYPEELKPAQLPNKIAVLARAKDKHITFSNLV